MSKFSFSKTSLCIAIVSVLVLCAGLPFACSFLANGLDAVQAISKAKKLIDINGSIPTAMPLLKLARKDPNLAPWANLLEAKLLLAAGEIPQAFEKLKATPTDHASSLDARLEILKLVISPNSSPFLPVDLIPNRAAYVGDLERDAQQGGRPEIATELEFIRAQAAESEKQPTLAYQTLSKVRERNLNTAVGTRAREAIAKLRNSYPTALGLVSIADFQKEALLLLKENQLTDALENILNGKSLASENTYAFFSLSVSHAQILRKLGKHAEATELLQHVIKNGEDAAPEAAIELAKFYLNNNTAGVIALASELDSKCTGSSKCGELYYLEGRALEDAGRDSEAIAAYKKVSVPQDLPTQLSALRRLAWVQLRGGHKDLSARSFEAILSEVENNNKIAKEAKEKSPLSSQLQDEYRHALYWRAKLILDNEVEKTASFNNPQLQEQAAADLRRLQKESPFSYYAMLAGNLLAKQYPDDKISPTLPLSDCYAEYPKKFVDHLQELKNYELLDFAEKELEWSFFRKKIAAKHGDEAASPPSSYFHKLTLTKASIYQKLNLFRQAVRSGLQITQTIEENPDAQAFVDSCRSEVNKQLYPLAFLDYYSLAKQQTGLSVALSLAISRRESHFDANALSPVGAEGIMQLMPATALQEGWDRQSPLSDPQINIALGTKYLASMMKRFDGNLAKAIAAYNAGPTAVENWNKNFPGATEEEWIELIGYPETRNYVKAVLVGIHIYSKLLPVG